MDEPSVCRTASASQPKPLLSVKRSLFLSVHLPVCSHPLGSRTRSPSNCDCANAEAHTKSAMTEVIVAIANDTRSTRALGFIGTSIIVTSSEDLAVQDECANL